MVQRVLPLSCCEPDVPEEKRSKECLFCSQWSFAGAVRQTLLRQEPGGGAPASGSDAAASGGAGAAAPGAAEPTQAGAGRAERRVAIEDWLDRGGEVAGSPTARELHFAAGLAAGAPAAAGARGGGGGGGDTEAHLPGSDGAGRGPGAASGARGSGSADPARNDQSGWPAGRAGSSPNGAPDPGGNPGVDPGPDQGLAERGQDAGGSEAGVSALAAALPGAAAVAAPEAAAAAGFVGVPQDAEPDRARGVVADAEQLPSGPGAGPYASEPPAAQQGWPGAGGDGADAADARDPYEQGFEAGELYAEAQGGYRRIRPEGDFWAQLYSAEAAPGGAPDAASAPARAYDGGGAGAAAPAGGQYAAAGERAGGAGAREPYEGYDTAAPGAWYAGTAPEAGYLGPGYGDAAPAAPGGGYAGLQAGDFGTYTAPANGAWAAAAGLGPAYPSALAPGGDAPGAMRGGDGYPDPGYPDPSYAGLGYAEAGYADGSPRAAAAPGGAGPGAGLAPGAADAAAEAAGGEVGGLVAQGKGLLREGRALARAGRELGRADGLLRGALAAFEAAAARAPDSAAVLARAPGGCCGLCAGPAHAGGLHVLRARSRVWCHRTCMRLHGNRALGLPGIVPFVCLVSGLAGRQMRAGCALCAGA